jgi:arylsulfatase A-like enzyme
MGPNVLLLVLDGARRDAFEPYGSPRGSTPAIAQLADRGAALPEVYATAPWTVPSHASFFTGLMPRAAGLTSVPSPADAKRLLQPHRDRFLPEVLRRAGYATVGVSANPWASALSGFDAGVDEFTQVRTSRTQRLDADRVRAKLGWTLEGVRGRVDDGAREAESVLEQWTSAGLRQPFFWFVNLTECHFPYLPPRPYGHMSPLGRARAAQDARRYYTLESVYRVCGRALDVPAATLERARRLYHGAIRYMDDWIARLLDRLDGLGILDDTLVIVTADHGENFGEDHLIGHMLSLDNRLIHVPFVAAGPGADGLELSSLAALPASIAELVGLPDHPWQDGPPMGVGVAQAEPLGSESDPNLRQAMDEQGIDDAVGRARLTIPLTCAVRDGLKVLRRGEREQLFDLTADPLELEPLPLDGVDGPRARVVNELRAALDHPAMATAEAGPQPQAADTPTMSDAEKEDLERQMKLLGYL